MQFFKDILYLFYPNLCVGCSNNLLQNEKIICSFCRHELPIIEFNKLNNKKLKSIFIGKIPIKKVRSFLYYRKHGKVQHLIHELKYKNQEEIGKVVGLWFGNLLRENNTFGNVDYIIPVPLHRKKLKKRGYNQLTKFGKSLSEILNIEYISGILIKTSITKTQTFKKRFERFSDSNTKFKLINTSIFEDKHVLLIDDVITTGATLEACCKELLKTKNITISIATMAFTEKT